MNPLKGLFLATALVGGIALAGAKPATAENLTFEDLIIPGLVVAGGLLIYNEVASNNGNRYRWRDSRRYQRYGPRPLPPGWIIANGRPWPRDVRPGKRHFAKHGHRHRHGVNHRHKY